MQLLDCFIPVLAFVRQFGARPDAEPAALAAQLDTLLGAAQQQALDQGHTPDEVREALYAIAAWTDETLLTCPWPAAEGWQRHLLQRRLFGVSNAGIGFYERFEKLSAAQGQAEAVYLMCLALGFSGRYGHGGNASERDFLQRAALQRALDGAAAGIDGAALLFPAGYAPGAEPARTRLRPRWMPSRLAVGVVTGSLALLAALYAAAHLLLTHGVDTLLPQIR